MSSRSLRNLSIGMVYDLRSDHLAEGHSEEEVAEFDSEETISAIGSAIRSLGAKPCRIGNAKALCRHLAAGRRWDLVFNIAEGLSGRSREAQAPAILELYGIPYVFSDPLTCAVTLDKAMAKRIVRDAGLATPAFRVIRSMADVDNIGMRFPLFAKPLAEGTGKGISSRSRITTRGGLRSVCRYLLEEYKQPVLVEQYMPGREFTTGILGTAGAAAVLGTMEIEVLGAEHDSIYSLATKEDCERLVKYSPLRNRLLRRAVEKLALDSYRELECRDAGRVDVRLDRSGRPVFLELNPLPGLHPTHSDLPMIAAQEGMPYKRMIEIILQSSISR